jgi:hypothetical protein
LTKIIKEHTHTGSIESGTAKGSENQYIGTNMMSYEDDNGDKLRYIQQAHLDHHNQALGFNHFNPTQISVARNHHLKSNTVMNEASTARIKVKAKLNELGLQLGKLNELGDYVKDGMASPGYTGNDDPAPQTIRKNDQLEEGPKLDKAKKVAMAGMTAANIYTLGDVMSKASSGHGSPKSDIVRAASTLPGAAGWAATGVHYAKKAYDKVKHMKEENKYPDTSERGIYEKAPPGDKFERMVKHIKAGYAKDGKLTKKEKGIAFATAWKAKKKEENMEEGYASIGHSFDWAGDVNHRAKFYGKKPKPTTTKNDEKDDTYKDSKQGGKVKFAKTVKEENLDEVSLGKLVRYKREREKDVRANEISSSHSQSMSDAHKGHDDKKHKEWSDEAKWLRGHGERMKKGIALADKKMKGKAKVNASAPKHPYMEETQIDEVSKALARRYKKEAKADLKHRKNSPNEYGSGNKMPWEYGDTDDPENRRKEGIKRANKILAREDTLDEVSLAKAATVARKRNKESESQAYGNMYDHSPTAMTMKRKSIQTVDRIGKKWGGDTARKVSKAMDKDEKKVWSGQYEEETVEEGRMPASVIKHKQRIANMTPEEKAKKFAGKSDEQLKSMARRHGYGKDSTEYSKHVKEENLDELKAETLGSYTKKAAASRKKSLEGSQPDIKTWAKRQKGITTAVKKLTSEAGSQDRDYDEASGFSEQTPSHLHLNKPDTKYAPGAAGITHTIHEETTMENQNLINEAIENILDNDLVAMKENLMVALQEKAQEKLEEKKKAIAANYFAQ